MSSNLKLADIPDIVCEYLDFCGYSQTSAYLKKEAIQSTSDGNLQSFDKKSISEILEAFDSGDREAFSLKWRVVPYTTRTTQPEALKLELQCQIYFYIYSLLPKSLGSDKKLPESVKSSQQKQRAATLISHLDSLRALDPVPPFMSEAETLSYLALPFIPNPIAHPSCAIFFKPEWSSTLRKTLQSFLERTAAAQPPEPTLHQIVNKIASNSAKQDAEALAQLRALMVQQQSEHINWKNVHSAKLAFFDAFSSELFDLSCEVLLALEGATAGKRLNAEYVQSVGQRLDRHAIAMQNLQDPQFFAQMDPSLAPVNSGPIVPLDFARVRQGLATLPDLDKCLLLQALRWRLSKCRLARLRTEITKAYVQGDILALVEPENSENLCIALITAESPLVREYALRLINTMCSEASGRTYFMECTVLVQLLLETIRTDRKENPSTDTQIRQNVLGILQKLSLRRKAQSKMIDLGAISLICSLVEEPDNCTEYTLEYGTALLMNLCLRSAGKTRVETDDKTCASLLQSMIALVEHENIQVRTYVNGVLYSVLTRPKIRDHARSLSLHDVLVYAIEHADEALRTQLNYVLGQLSIQDEDQGVDDGAESGDEWEGRGDEEEGATGGDDTQDPASADSDDFLPEGEERELELIQAYLHDQEGGDEPKNLKQGEAYLASVYYTQDPSLLKKSLSASLPLPSHTTHMYMPGSGGSQLPLHQPNEHPEQTIRGVLRNARATPGQGSTTTTLIRSSVSKSVNFGGLPPNVRESMQNPLRGSRFGPVTETPLQRPITPSSHLAPEDAPTKYKSTGFTASTDMGDADPRRKKESDPVMETEEYKVAFAGRSRLARTPNTGIGSGGPSPASSFSSQQPPVAPSGSSSRLAAQPTRPARAPVSDSIPSSTNFVPVGGLEQPYGGSRLKLSTDSKSGYPDYEGSGSGKSSVSGGLSARGRSGDDGLMPLKSMAARRSDEQSMSGLSATVGHGAYRTPSGSNPGSVNNSVDSIRSVDVRRPAVAKKR